MGVEKRVIFGPEDLGMRIYLKSHSQVRGLKTADIFQGISFDTWKIIA